MNIYWVLWDRCTKRAISRLSDGPQRVFLTAKQHTEIGGIESTALEHTESKHLVGIWSYELVLRPPI